MFQCYARALSLKRQMFFIPLTQQQAVVSWRDFPPWTSIHHVGITTNYIQLLFLLLSRIGDEAPKQLTGTWQLLIRVSSKHQPVTP